MGAKMLKIKWPELGKEVLISPAKSNAGLFYWFLENTPCKSVQSHAVISGKFIYTMNIPLRKPMTFKYWELEKVLCTEAPLGTLVFWFTRGRVGGISIKYGDMTEDMSYPILGQVRKEDLEVLKKVGSMVWDAIYNTKKIITCEFEEA